MNTDANSQAARAQHAMGCVVYNAQQCEGALRLAAFAAEEPSLSRGIAQGMRKLASFHSEHAFRAAQGLARIRGVA